MLHVKRKTFQDELNTCVFSQGINHFYSHYKSACKNDNERKEKLKNFMLINVQ